MKFSFQKKSTALKSFSLVLGVLFGSCLLTSCGKQSQENFNSFEEINEINPVIGIDNTLEVNEQAKELMPNATLSYYTDFSAALSNLANGKYNGVIASDFLCNEAISSDEYNLKVFDQPIQTYDIGLGLSNNSKIDNFVNRVNGVIEKFKSDGTLEEMRRNWNYPGAKRIMPEISLDGYEDEIRCVTNGQLKPNSYFDGTELKGFDVELSYRIAKELECRLTIETADFPSMLLGLSTGKYDMISSNLYITEKREENFSFSISYQQNYVKMVVNDPYSLEFKTYKSLEGKHKLAVITGGAVVNKVKTRFPEAEIVYCNSVGDGILSVQNKKADAFFHDAPVLNFACSVHEDFGLIPERFCDERFSFLTAKDEAGEAIKQEFNIWLAKYKKEGKLDKAYKFWTSNEEAKTFPFDSLKEENGILNFGLFLDSRPATYLFNNSYAGFPNEIIYEFCKDNGYGANFIPQGADSFVAAIETHKIDIMTGFIAYTEERAQKINYTDTICEDGIATFVRRTGQEKKSSIFNRFTNGFKKTFIEENRYKMIFNGLGTTLIITFFGFLLANILGACFCSLSLSKKRWVQAFDSIYQYIIQGTPVVVIILHHIW